MECPNCREYTLVPAMTKQGVEVDFCQKCEGIWLDQNEIYHFTNTPTYLKAKIEEAIKAQRPSQKISPLFNKPMVELPLFDGQITIDYCTVTEGIWLDKDEINMLPALKSKIQIDKSMLGSRKESAASVLIPLPNLALRSGMVLFGLYALLTLFLIIVVEVTRMPAEAALFIGIAFALMHFLLGPFLMDLSLRFLYKMQWVSPGQLPAHLKNFIDSVCQQQRITFPRMGIILDGSPNAFTYGHHPNNARIVITQGLLDLLDEKESEAVVAHEIGHAVHWDMLIMTLAQLVPLILYYIYKTLIKMRSSGRDKTAPYRMAIAISAYILYIVSEFIVLWFSRLREYFADRFSGEATRDPSALASALVKIGYGLAGDDSRKKAGFQNDRKETINAVGPMGIFDAKTANILAITGYMGPQRMGGAVSKEKIIDAAKWDLWNPWATYYELQSTHPLIAKRLKFLSNQAVAIGKEPYIEFVEKRPESYWDEFFVDLFMQQLPFIVFLAALILFMVKQDMFIAAMGMSIFGLTYLFRVLFSYPVHDFAPMTVQGLLKKVKVSAVRPVACVIKGTIIGRGVPGLIFSEDFVMQDETGIIFINYNQPLGLIFNFLFGLLKAQKYIGKEAEIIGWYRRAPVPYIEIKNIKTAERQSTCFVYNAKLIFSALFVIAGLLVALKALGFI